MDRDWVADCDLLNPNAQDLRAAGGDVCGAFANRNFGNPNVFSNTVDPDIQHGWGVRPSDWNFGVSVQHELIPRVSIDVGYVRRVFHGFNVTDNLAIGPNDVTEFYVTAPQDSRLPGGGGYQVADSTTSTRMSSVRPTITTSEKPRQSACSSTAWTSTPTPGCRSSRAGRLQLGRTTSDSCEVRAKVPETALLDPHATWSAGICHTRGSQPTTFRKSTFSSA